MATTASSTFRIKLLSGNNVVLVEAAGYDSEIFMPEVVNGRITFLNIIPERRCCDNPVTLKRSRPHKKAGKYAARPQSPLQAIKPKMISPDTSSHSTSSLLKTQPAAISHFTHSPQAFSTPMPAQRRGSPVRHHGHSARSPGKENELPTPPAARCAFAALAASNAKTYQVPSPFQVLRETHMPIPPGIKMVRLFRNPSPAKPKHLAHVATINLDDAAPQPPEPLTPRRGILHRSPRHSSFDLPPSPRLAAATPAAAASPPPLKGKRASSSPLPSKWRHKVITPIRTYSRRRIAAGSEQAATLQGDSLLTTGTALPAQAKTSTSRDTPQPPAHPHPPHTYPKVIPTYLVNPTQGTQAQCTVRFRRKRKLVVDERTQLTPRGPGEAAATAAEEKEPAPACRTANPIPSPGAASIRGSSEHRRCNNTPTRRRHTSLPRTRRHYERSKMSAFALLTNPSRPFCLSARLLAQFRKGCVNKAASTYAKCKVLATLPPEDGPQA